MQLNTHGSQGGRIAGSLGAPGLSGNGPKNESIQHVKKLKKFSLNTFLKIQ